MVDGGEERQINGELAEDVGRSGKEVAEGKMEGVYVKEGDGGETGEKMLECGTVV